MKTIYTKNTVSRKKEFQITTSIFIDGDKTYVSKKGIFSSAHINRMKTMVEKYNKVYQEYVDLPLSSYDNEFVVPYIDGESLLEYAYKDLDKAILIYNNMLDLNSKTLDFKPTEEFISIFGKVDCAGKSLSISNIDFIFSNLIIQDNKNIKIIDLEWIFDFPVPLDYIKYRAYLELCDKIPDVNREKILSLLQINTNLDTYEEMEKNFQSYVCTKSYKDILNKEEKYIFNSLKCDEIERDRLNSIINKQNETVNSLNHEIYVLNQSEISKKNEITELKSNIESLEKNNDELKDLINQYKTDLSNTKREIERIKSSPTYRFWIPYFKVRDFLLPPNSKRRLYMKLFLKCLRHPIWFFKHLSPTNLKKFHRYSKSEGLNRTLERIDIYKENNDNATTKTNLILFDMNQREDYSKIKLPECSDNIEVSIIIPVYNHFSYTYGCIESIIKHTAGIDYEVIIADDCSTDETKKIHSFIDNIQVIKTKTNSGFLENCNNAALHAKGKYLLFLNNDTNVQPNWLSSLLETIKKDNVGLVGSKLVYPNGLLQEAGGILWNDGSAWNYGNKSDPEYSEYNYRKEADYISGASIMISKELWTSIGGFDTRYKPAYCEDSDLAFEVRKHGYKVIYDPFSVVVHYEGISNGTNVNSGIKKYQIENSKKFFEKWKNELSKHYPNGKNLFVARDRSNDKKTVLFIDHYVPQFDKDAGSRTVFLYIKLLVELGYNVKFIGDNFYRHEPYTSILQKMGVEVLYGPYYAQNYLSWLSENGQFIDYVFFNRPHITKKYIDDVIKTCNRSKFIYYGHDLHYVRVEREALLKNDNTLLNEANEWKKTEFKIFSKVDLILYPSYNEVNILKQEFPSYNIMVLQPYAYEIDENKEYSFNKRKDIMFVGGFRHGPNYDGIKWFIQDVLPEVLSKIPDLVLHVVGSYPPEELLNMQSKNVKVEGFVSDDDLIKLYEEVRLVVVPLRYGAGIKGKVIEAMSHGVPVLTTTCGAEGIETDALKVDDTMLSLSILYDDENWLALHSKKSLQYIKECYSIDSAKKQVVDFIKELQTK